MRSSAIEESIGVRILLWDEDFLRKVLTVTLAIAESAVWMKDFRLILTNGAYEVSSFNRHFIWPLRRNGSARSPYLQDMKVAHETFPVVLVYITYVGDLLLVDIEFDVDMSYVVESWLLEMWAKNVHWESLISDTLSLFNSLSSYLLTLPVLWLKERSVTLLINRALKNRDEFSAWNSANRCRTTRGLHGRPSCFNHWQLRTWHTII